MALDPLEDKVKDVLQRLGAEGASFGPPWDKDAYWTREIKTRVCQLGKDQGFYVRATDGCSTISGMGAGEWLYDVVWLSLDGAGESWHHLLDSVLVLESEWSWNGQEQDKDFCRLLLARATFRVFVFNRRTAREIDRKVGEYQHQVRRFRRSEPGDRYLFAGFVWNERRFAFSSYVMGHR